VSKLNGVSHVQSEGGGGGGGGSEKGGVMDLNRC
jgi:hypothetical protein